MSGANSVPKPRSVGVSCHRRLHYSSTTCCAPLSARDGSDMRRSSGAWFFDVRAGSEHRRGDRTVACDGFGCRLKTVPERAEFKRTARCPAGETWRVRVRSVVTKQPPEAEPVRAGALNIFKKIRLFWAQYMAE